MRRLLTVALIVACVCQSSVAMETNKQKKSGAAPATEVQMPFLIAPVGRDGEFLGYMYIATKLITPSAEASQKVKEKLAFIQDALVRDVYDNMVATDPDAQKMDRTALSARIVGIARRFAGAPNVVKLVIIDIKFAPLHPLPGGGMFAPAGGESPPGGAAPPPATSQPKKDGQH